LLIACPEAERDDLVRVGLAGDRARVRTHGCAAATEARHSQIEPVPEEGDRARLAAEPPGELVEHLVGPVEEAPEALDRRRTGGGVLAVVGARGRGRHAVRRLADGDVDSEASEGAVELLVERGHGKAALELERLDRTVARLDQKAVVDEVEADLDAATGAGM